MDTITNSSKDNKEKNILLSDWLNTNTLGRCPVFNARLSERGCSAVKASNKHKLDTLEYDDLNEVDYSYCTNACRGLKF